MNGVFYCRPSDIVTDAATVALTSGTENAAFPLTNLYDLNPAKVFKATGTSCTIRLTYGAAQALQAIALIMHNLVGASVTVTNNGGMATQTIVIPANAEDGLSVDPFLDLRPVANASATQWNIVITGAAANVAIGELLAVETLRDMEVGRELRRGDVIPQRMNVTASGVKLIYPLGVRLHRISAITILESLRSDLLALWHGALGMRHGFLVIPDLNVNVAYFMRFAADDFPWVHTTDEMTDMTIALEDVGRGPGV